MKNNLDTIINQTLKYAKKIAKEFYFKEWAKNPPKCQAFDGEIIDITREGWEHITHHEVKTKTDVIGRLFVLERAKVLLETTTLFNIKEVKEEKTYWILEGAIQGVRIKVIVRSIDDGPKHFLSVIKKGTIIDEIEKNSKQK